MLKCSFWELSIIQEVRKVEIFMFPLQIADLELPFRYFLNNGAVRMQFFFYTIKKFWWEVNVI